MVSSDLATASPGDEILERTAHYVVEDLRFIRSELREARGDTPRLGFLRERLTTAQEAAAELVRSTERLIAEASNEPLPGIAA